MPSLHDFVFLLPIVALAYIMRGITGFGSALIAVPLLAFSLPLNIVVPLIILLDYIATVGHGIHQRKFIQWSYIFPLLPSMLFGIICALYIFSEFKLENIKSVLGIFILLYALYNLTINKPHQHPSRLWSIPAGFLGGTVGTLFGTGGPFHVIYLQLQGLDKTTFRATLTSIFFVDGGLRLIGFTFSGHYQEKTLILALFSLPVMIISLYIGEHIHTNIQPRTFQKAISCLLIVSGIGLLLS